MRKKQKQSRRMTFNIARRRRKKRWRGTRREEREERKPSELYIRNELEILSLAESCS